MQAFFAFKLQAYLSRIWSMHVGAESANVRFFTNSGPFPIGHRWVKEGKRQPGQADGISDQKVTPRPTSRQKKYHSVWRELWKIWNVVLTDRLNGPRAPHMRIVGGSRWPLCGRTLSIENGQTGPRVDLSFFSKLFEKPLSWKFFIKINHVGRRNTVMRPGVSHMPS